MAIDSSNNNKRIAKNTLLLYVRMLFLMVVSLFTSRVILNTLGVEDFGIYNVVGGIVAMFTIISGSLTSAISRFLTFELGKGDKEKLKTIFSTSVNIQLGLSAIIILIGEFVGIWFLNNQMNIPAERMMAANYILQCSLGIFVLNLLSVPYNASIIAHEKMGAYAYISILDIILKLAVAYAIMLSPFDRLISYGVLLLAESIFIRLIYGLYSKRNFDECTYHLIYDKAVLRKMVSFAGWNFLGVTAGTLNTQGVNILMNVYFGVTVNAARGIAVQAGAAISQFVQSFTTAVNPQITKSYAVGDITYMHTLVCQSSKFSAYLFLLMAIPLSVETPEIFEIWLKNPPEYAVLFFRLSLLGTLMDSVLSNSLMTAIFATGDIKKYQVYVTICGGTVFPLTWLAYLMGASPDSTYIIYFIIYCVVLYVRLYVIQQKVHLQIKEYARRVLVKFIPVAVLSYLVPISIAYLMPASFGRILITTIVSVVITCAIIYSIGLTIGERNMVMSKVKKITNKYLSK